MALYSIKSSILNAPLYQGALNSMRSIKQKGLNILPNANFSDEKFLYYLNYIGKNFSSDKQRLALGVTALATQPFIDAQNKKVDEETRKVSVARTVAKIIAGTLTGYYVRAGCIKLIDEMTKLPSEVKNPNSFGGKLRMLFTPDDAKTGALKSLKKYKNALGTTISLVVMLFTNFLIDAPLTKYLTNLFTDKFIKPKDQKGGTVNE